MAQTFAAALPGQTSTASGEASLSDIGRAVLRHWRWVAIPTLVAFLASAIFVSVVSPRYTGEAKLLLQTGDSYFTRPNQDRLDQTPLIDEQAVASQVQVVMSRDLAREAIRRLNLVGNPEFDPAVRPQGPMQQVSRLLGLSRDPSARAPEDRVLESYYDHLLVYPVGKSRIVSVEFRSRDPDLSAQAANTVAELYLDGQNDAKKDLARSASTWLGSNIDDLRTRLSQAEEKVELFRARTGLLSGTGTGTLSGQQLSELSAQLTQARTAQSDSQARAQLIRDLIRDGRGFEIPDVANNELVRRLIEQRINLRAQLALEQRTLLPQHPRIKELNAQLGDLEGQVRGSAERTARTLENDTRIAGSRVASLEAAIDAQKKVVAQANESEVQLRALEREARAQRDQLESYLTRYREAMARDQGNVSAPDARIVSRSVVPQIPSFPKKLPIVALSTLAALVLSVGAIVARELLRSPAPSGATYAYDPERQGEDARGRAAADRYPAPYGFEAPAYAGRALPLTLDANRVAPVPVPPVATRPRAAVEPAEAAPDGRYDFAQLVARLRAAPARDGARRAFVTGIGSGREAGDLARGLADALSAAERAILVEFDPDESIETDQPGLTDLVAGEATFSEVIRAPRGSRTHRIGVGTLRNEALRAEPEGLDVALSAIEKTYDWIICVSLTGADADLLRLLAPRVDAVVIASSLEPANQDLVRTYEAAQEAGAKDVAVARDQTVGPAAGSVAA